MALKDLVANNAKLMEAAVEKIVLPYIRYDIDERELSLMPAFSGLNNRAKILVYLVGLQGWRFVDDALEIAVATKPSSLESKLGIPGGSLRPALKELKERHLLFENDGAYAVRGSSLDAIHSEISGAQPATTKPRSKSSKVARSKKTEQSTDTAGNDAPKKKVKSRAAGSGKGAQESFSRWIDEGFFATSRSLADVEGRFHEEAIIIPKTSIPQLFLRAVRAKRLRRFKQDAGGKSVWTYENVKATRQ